MIQEGDIIYNIELLRKMRNMTQTFLARESGMTPQTYSRAKQGEGVLKVVDLINIAKTLNVSVELIIRKKIEVPEVTHEDP